MRLWKTTDDLPVSGTDQYHVYNALDCCVTFEVFEKLEKQLDEVTGPIYELERALQGPVLEMDIHGVKIDITARDDMIRTLVRDQMMLEDSLQEILQEGIGVKLNPMSPKQLAYLLYDVLGLPVQRNFKSGSRTVDEKALNKLKNYFHAMPIINHILAIRDLSKQISMLKTSLDNDGRIRTSFGIAGTDTGRFSSYISALDTGSNLQTVTERIRHVFVSDPGYRMAYIDLEQAESRGVGAIEWNLFHDGTYLDATESEDLHTLVTKMCWPKLEWTGNIKLDKEVAKQLFYRVNGEDISYRVAAKTLSHGSNYLGKPPTMAQHSNIPLALVQDFQGKYFKSFPAHQKWHSWVASKLLKDGFITSFMGRRRMFFGRRWDESTLRAAVAYEPQSAIADYLNRGMLAVWKANICQLLLQEHDAILIQYPEEKENEIIPQVQKLLQLRIPLLYGRELVIPTEALVGWNWGYFSEKNPNGLKPFIGSDPRVRVKSESILDRKFSEA
jgi:DNA polymerase-1